MNTMPGNTVLSGAVLTADFKLASNIDRNVQNSKANESVDFSVQPSSDVKPAPSMEQIDEALQVVNKAVVFEQRSLSFMVDEASGRSIIKVMDKTNDQLIRQIPSEELLKVAQDIKKLQEEMGQSLGFLIDRQV
jgi:flagellar protein FlaG